MTKKITIVVAAVLVFAATFMLRQLNREARDSESGPPVEHVGRALPRLVDLGSDQCIPCKQMAPVLEGLSKEYRGSLIVEVLDVRKNPAAGREWGIRVIPTQVFIDATGTERFRHEGFMAKEAILEKWKEIGVDLSPTGCGVGS